MLDPEARSLLDLMEKAAQDGRPKLETLPYREGRAAVDKMSEDSEAEPLAVGEIDDGAFAGPGGEIRFRHYTPFNAADGKVAWEAKIDEWKPEHPFPAPIEDGVAAFRHIRDHAASFSADPARIAVGGDSAGGAIAAVVCQICRDAGETVGTGGPAFQMLIYPATDSSRESASRKAFAKGYFLTKELMDWFWKAYVPAGTDLADLRLSPLLARDVAGLPPAFVLTAGYDPLRDEGRAYAERLIEAGIKTTYANYPGTIHGFFSLTRFLQQGLKANDEAAAVLGAHFGT